MATVKSPITLFADHRAFLESLRQHTQLFHLSNVFFRDIHYGVMGVLERNKLKFNYRRAEDLTKEVIRTLEQSGTLRRLDDRTWLLQYPPFKAVGKKAEPAKA